jgi:glycosyltransferase involved in cell wall biosynthesis
VKNINRAMSKLEKIKIAYCEGNTDGTIGGSYYSLLFLVESLDKSRFDPIVIFRNQHGLWHRFKHVSEVYEVPVWVPVKRGYYFLRRGVNFIRFLMMSVKEALFLRRHRIQLLHLNNSVTRNHDWMIAAIIAGIPCITHERGINPKISWLTKVLGGRLRSVICISSAVRNTLLQSGLSSTPLYIIHNGLDPSRIQPGCTADQFRSAHHIPPTHHIIGMIGNIKQWKGQEVVIKALPDIVRRFPEILCLFVGDTSPEDAPYKSYLRQLIEDVGMQEHVLFTGYCPNVADALNVMEVTIHASVAPEPFGRVLLESMAMKRPVVASRDGAVVEIVIEGKTGFTFTPGNSSELAERVICLLESRDKVEIFGDAGYRRLLSDFSIMQNVARTIDIYESIIG